MFLVGIEFGYLTQFSFTGCVISIMDVWSLHWDRGEGEGEEDRDIGMDCPGVDLRQMQSSNL